MASEGEYVIPANVVRFIGVDKIEKMVAKAKEQLIEMGEDPEPDNEELPFDMNELEALPIEGMAEGGMVEGTGGMSEVKEFTDQNGRTIYVPFFNGEPLYDIPQGYKEGGASQGDKPKTQEAKIDPISGGSANPNVNNDPSPNERTDGASPLAGNPNQWSVEDFVKFGQQRGSAGEMALKGMASMLPGGKLAVAARQRYLDGASSELLDKMLDEGVDMQGQALSQEQRTLLSDTRQDLINNMGQQSGLNLKPMTRLGDAFKTFSNFVSGNKASGGGEPKSSVKPEAQRMLSTQSSSDDKYSGGSHKVGSDIGRDPSKGPSSGSIASGGLYHRGGLITRPR
jgi:hypothetical protein